MNSQKITQHNINQFFHNNVTEMQRIQTDTSIRINIFFENVDWYTITQRRSGKDKSCDYVVSTLCGVGKRIPQTIQPLFDVFFNNLVEMFPNNTDRMLFNPEGFLPTEKTIPNKWYDDLENFIELTEFLFNVTILQENVIQDNTNQDQYVYSFTLDNKGNICKTEITLNLQTQTIHVTDIDHTGKEVKWERPKNSLTYNILLNLYQLGKENIFTLKEGE